MKTSSLNYAVTGVCLVLFAGTALAGRLTSPESSWAPSALFSVMPRLLP